jgi:RHS repeat-associated protein
MVCVARAFSDDEPPPSRSDCGIPHLFARAANDNAPLPDLATTFTLDTWGNVTATSDPLTHTSNQTFDLDRRLLLAIAPDPGTGTGARPATNTTYDANGRAIEVDKGTTNAAGTTFTAVETTDTAFDPLNRTTQALIGTGSYGILTYDSLGRRQTLTFQDTSSQTWHGACPRAGQRPDPGDNADRVTSIVHVFPNETTDNATYTYTYDPSGRDASRIVNNSVYRHHPTAASTTYATANALNQYPSVNSYPYTYWQEGELNETDTLQTNYNEFGKLMLAYITTTPGTIDPNNFDFMGVDALDHVYYHGRQASAGDTHPFIYHATDGLRPETILEWQCLQTGGGTPTCSGTGTGTRRYILGPDPDERWAFLDMDGTVYAPHTDREGTTIALGAGGAAALKLSYDAYGQSPNAASATDVGPGVNSYLYRYTGQRLDPNTQLFDYKARDYSPVLGRFYQPDPKGVDQGPNLYEYTGGDPLGAGNPTGTACISLNEGSPYCVRARMYTEIDSRVSTHTRFFGAAALTVAMFADLDLPTAEKFTSTTFRTFMGGVSRDLETMNISTAIGIELGSISGPHLDTELVHKEQSAVQGHLDALEASDPVAYKEVVTEANNLLNPQGLETLGANILGSDRAYQAVLNNVRKSLGRNIDFSKQSDREAVGKAVINKLRDLGKCSATGSHIFTC